MEPSGPAGHLIIGRQSRGVGMPIESNVLSQGLEITFRIRYGLPGLICMIFMQYKLRNMVEELAPSPLPGEMPRQEPGGGWVALAAPLCV